MKENRGISLIELVIVMIIMILIISFAVYSGIDSINKSEATELYEEMNSMVSAVNGIMIKKELGEYDDAWLADYYDEDLLNGWYLIKESSGTSEKLGVETLKRNYLVNFETGEVILETPVVVLETEVQTYESIRRLVESDKI